MAMFDLKNKTAVVFGGSRGIGRATAILLAECGCNVYVASKSKKSLDDLESFLSKNNYKVRTITCDVSNEKDVENVINKAVEETKSLDIVINNAGIVSITPYLETDSEELRTLVNTNIYGVDNGAKLAIKKMIELGIEGKIVNIASIEGRHATFDGYPYYGMTKASVIYLTQAQALAAAKYNINVNCVCPGIIRTDMWEKILDDYEKRGYEREEMFKNMINTYIPLKRGSQKPEDIAYTIVFLSSKYADNITGQSINVDGGEVLN